MWRLTSCNTLDVGHLGAGRQELLFESRPASYIGQADAHAGVCLRLVLEHLWGRGYEFGVNNFKNQHFQTTHQLSE